MLKNCVKISLVLWKPVERIGNSLLLATTKLPKVESIAHFLTSLTDRYPTTLPQPGSSLFKKLNLVFTHNPQHLQLTITKEK